MTMKNIQQPASASKTYRCGTLTYTKIGLTAVLAWLLWGDFCFTLMEAVVPSIVPLKLKGLGCPNWMMGVILSTVPGILHMTVCPYVSFKSDRFRSRWGRRIPFIVCTMPFLCISLAMLGWSDDISLLLQKYSPALTQFAPATLTVVLIGFFMIMFQFFNMFVSSVFWYLFNDVVPPQVIGRFVGILRIITMMATTLYNFFIFKYAESHIREIFLGAAVLYFVGFGIMCLMVKEGEYPPVGEDAAKAGKGLAGLKTFFSECFTHKFYWMIFISSAFYSISYAISAFMIFFNREMGLSLDQIGKLVAVNGIAQMTAMYFTAVFVDRWNPVRIVMYNGIFNLISGVMPWVWIFVSFPGNYFFWLCLGTTLTASFQLALYKAASFPRDMRLFPQSRFGQFCSAQAMAVSVSQIIGGVAAGLFIDVVRYFCHNSDFAYRFIFIWTAAFQFVAVGVAVFVYILWHQMGGDKKFQPPAPWSPEKVEEMQIVPSIGPQTKWLHVAFRLFDIINVLSVLSIPVLMWWMQRQQAMVAFKWFGLLILPLSIAVWVWWIIIKRNILQDMECSRSGQPLRNGIPHHGMLIVVSIKFLLALGLWGVQVVISVNMNMDSWAIVFGIANIVTNFMLVGSVLLLSRIERGFSTTLDEKMSAV